MKFIHILFLSLLVSINVFSQTGQIISYDLKAKITDTLNYVSNVNIAYEKTNFDIGSFNNNFSPLCEKSPTKNTFPNSWFTIKERVELDYNINDFPIRTSIKLFRSDNGTLIQKCSGSMVSRKHVLTACHCVFDPMTGNILYDSLLVTPAFDNGIENLNFEGSWVKKYSILIIKYVRVPI